MFSLALDKLKISFRLENGSSSVLQAFLEVDAANGTDTLHVSAKLYLIPSGNSVEIGGTFTGSAAGRIAEIASYLFGVIVPETLTSAISVEALNAEVLGGNISGALSVQLLPPLVPEGGNFSIGSASLLVEVNPEAVYGSFFVQARGSLNKLLADLDAALGIVSYHPQILNTLHIVGYAVYVWRLLFEDFEPVGPVESKIVITPDGIALALPRIKAKGARSLELTLEMLGYWLKKHMSLDPGTEAILELAGSASAGPVRSTLGEMASAAAALAEGVPSQAESAGPRSLSQLQLKAGQPGALL
jgi:hypothetical protein